ncbi:MAG: glycoside hydrolase domain-containing protein [Planctomycetota bacterium]
MNHFYSAKGKGIAVAAASFLFITLVAFGAEKDKSAAKATTPPANPVILSTGQDCYWRWFVTWKTPLIRAKSGELVTPEVPKGIWGRLKCPTLIGDPGQRAKPLNSTLPPTAWTTTDFDDSSWIRSRNPHGWTSQELALLCLRGRFEVADPAGVGGLELALTYWGGAIVYLNGKELARGNLPDSKPDTPAEAYPADACLDDKGKLIKDSLGKDSPLNRRLAVTIPASALRKGTNVLAIELRRAPPGEAFFNAAQGELHSRTPSILLLRGAVLTAPTGTVVTPASRRPEGFRAWNHDVCLSLHNADWGGEEPLRPVRITGTRGGVHSGMIGIGSTGPLKNLRAEISPLKNKDRAEIPAAAVAVLWPRTADHCENASRDMYPRGKQALARFDTLAETPPAEVPVIPESGGSTQPVWVTVRVPHEAAPGAYGGTLTVSADGAKPLIVPVELRVADWNLQDPKKFTTILDLPQSPDTVAIQYGVPMWSDKHWQLMEKSFRLLGEVGADVIYIPLIRHTHFGNEHTMVRWIRKADGGWDHDFGIVEKYLDLAVKHLGKIPTVCLYCWEPFTGGAYLDKPGKEGKGMLFTILDPKTGALEEAEGPKWNTPEIRPFWKPVFDGLRKRLADRGMEKSMVVGLAQDTRPSKECVEDLKAVAPDARWALHTHSHTRQIHGQPVGNIASVWGMMTTPYPEVARYRGWTNEYQETCFPRCGAGGVDALRTWSSLVKYRLAVETMLTSPGTASGGYKGLRGLGRVGLDFWPALQKGGSPASWGEGGLLAGRYPESGWGQLGLVSSTTRLLAPGPDGAISTVRFEMLREGLQETEARIFIEKALADPTGSTRLGEDLARRCQDLLDERTRALVKAIEITAQTLNEGGVAPVHLTTFSGSGWQERTEKLYALAAEASKK